MNWTLIVIGAVLGIFLIKLSELYEKIIVFRATNKERREDSNPSLESETHCLPTEP